MIVVWHKARIWKSALLGSYFLQERWEYQGCSYCITLAEFAWLVAKLVYVTKISFYLFCIKYTNDPSVPIQMSKARGKRIIKIYYRPYGITGCLVNFFWRRVKWVVNLAAVGTGTTKQVNNWSQPFAIYLKIYDRKIFSHVSCTSEQPLFFISLFANYLQNTGIFVIFLL